MFFLNYPCSLSPQLGSFSFSTKCWERDLKVNPWLVKAGLEIGTSQYIAPFLKEGTTPNCEDMNIENSKQTCSKAEFDPPASTCRLASALPPAFWPWSLEVALAIPLYGVLIVCQALGYPGIVSVNTILPGEHFDCFHFSKKKTEAQSCQVTFPRSHSCQNRIGTQNYLPLISEHVDTAPHH